MFHMVIYHGHIIIEIDQDWLTFLWTDEDQYDQVKVKDKDSSPGLEY